MVKGRFAPSPTGRMHLGNVFCALLSWLSAKSRGGEWLLRIEDLDPQRSRKEYALQLMDDLEWLGLAWDNEPVWQSQRNEVYEHYLNGLNDMGLTYPCHCTRADIMATQAPHESDGRVVYKGTCRPDGKTERHALASSTQATTRMMVPDEIIPFCDGHYGRHDINLTEHCGDYIVRRKDGAWAYQLAVVVDDALMGVTEIVRGRDLLLSSPQQIHLRQVLFPEDTTAAPPPKLQFFHHPLLCNEQGQRLCKRDKSMDLGYLRDRGTDPKAITGLLAHLAGLMPEPVPMSPQELLSVFDWDKVPVQDIIVF
ncbi:MAG: tRNA glutamyl-Q(34) synthetase GluQRS [Bacteroides sp.]|nr:tRNA glutamyl-Q(34) synthetase GluQRS [Bacteroides sp.]MCM1447537.1 tRNA glutamyl-Q(34) synthetase GluQRS [Bacteroides sp.]